MSHPDSSAMLPRRDPAQLPVLPDLDASRAAVFNFVPMNKLIARVYEDYERNNRTTLPTWDSASDYFGYASTEVRKDILDTIDYDVFFDAFESVIYFSGLYDTASVLPLHYNPIPPFTGMLKDDAVHYPYVEALGVDPNSTDDTQFGTDYIYCSGHVSAHIVGWCDVPNVKKAPLPVNKAEDGAPNLSVLVAHTAASNYARDSGFSV